MNTNTGGYAPDPRRWWERVLSRLFPAQHIEPPEDIEGFAPGYTRTEIHVHMDWLDRLRALVSGRVTVTVITQTDVHVSKMRIGSTFWVNPPFSKRW